MNDPIETLVNNNLALAHSMALMFGVSDEVVSDAMYGLYKAATRYDASKGYTFATFAHSVIKRTILNGIRSRKNNCICLTDINSEDSTIEAVDYRTANTSDTAGILVCCGRCSRRRRTRGSAGQIFRRRIVRGHGQTPGDHPPVRTRPNGKRRFETPKERQVRRIYLNSAALFKRRDKNDPNQLF